MSSCALSGPADDPAALYNSLVAMMPGAKSQGRFFLRESAREFFRRSEVWREQRIALLVRPGQLEVLTPSLSYGRIGKVVAIWMRAGGGEVPIPRHETLHSGPADPLVIGGDCIGEQRWFSPHRGRISFHRPFVADRDVALRVHAILAPDEGGKEVSAELLEEYRETVLSGAMYRAAMAQGVKTEDQRAAQMHRADFDRGVLEARLKYARTFDTHRPEASRPRSEMGRYGSMARR